MSGQESALQKKLAIDTKEAQKIVAKLDKLEDRELHDDITSMEEQILAGDGVGIELKKELVRLLKEIRMTTNSLAPAPIIENSSGGLSDEDLMNFNKTTEEKTGWTTMLQRIKNQNADIAWLVAIIAFVALLSYSIASIRFSWTIEGVDGLDSFRTTWSDYFYTVIWFVGAALSTIFKVGTPPGSISTKMSRKANKRNVDKWGRTLRG